MAIYSTFKQLDDVPRASLFAGPGDYELREEQKEAVAKAMKHFGTTPRGGSYTVAPDYRQFLWNAKMRFGKTLCALHLAREMGVRRVLIITHRPVVNEEWVKNFDMVFARVGGEYAYGTRSDNDNYGNYYDLEKFANRPGGHYVFFASMQYLRRSNLVGGDNDEKLKRDLLQTDWDLVIVDEAHEGTRTALGQRVIALLKKQRTKMLHLSGTPFNLYEDFRPGEIYTWDYLQEQQAKRDWPQHHPGEPNPYEELPQMKIFTFDLGRILGQFIEEGASFRFTEFFRTWEGQRSRTGEEIPADKRGRFVHEEAVRRFLDKLCEPSETNNYPFSTDRWQQLFNHTLWIVPGVREARALKQLLCEHPVFGSFGEENIINVAGNGAEDEEREEALERVKNRIGERPELTATITISCGRLTTGVTVRPWTAVFYMKGSEMTSAATYMQTIFRVQSPYVERDADGTPVRMKQECYVFDFAPDRSLKMVAETAKFSSLAKRERNRTAGSESLTQEERDRETMRGFLEMCPVVSLDDGQMLPFDEQRLFRELERVFIDRLVATGFNDKCLYNPDELMAIDADELNELGKKIAQTSNMEKPKNATPNAALQLNPLSDEERQRLEEARRKERENRRARRDPHEGLSPEEIAALEAERQRRKKELDERDRRITNLRGISLRIPLLMYGGADAGDPDEDLTVENFTRKIKDESWEEFMPRGVTKKDFNAIRRCFNATRFEEAGKRYRALAREADTMHVEERVRRIADIFACFHNPDKETVLTPWRVVNMHLSDTLGGYCFFNERFDGPCQKELQDAQGRVVDIVQTTEPRYVDRGEATRRVFEDSEARILEINSKTGLYPLYVAYSLYRRRMRDFYAAGLIEEHSVEEEQVVWDDIVRNNIYVICNTPMAVRITQRTLFGFREDAVDKANIKSRNLIQEATTNPEELVKTIRSVGFWQGTTSKKQMEFSAVVSNPPYMLKKEDTSDTSIYHIFMELGFSVSDLATFITPGRFLFNAGNTPRDFNRRVLNDEHFKVVWYEPDPKKIFENVDVKGGIAVTLRDKRNNFGKIRTFTSHHELSTILPKVIDRPDFRSIDNMIVLQSKFNLETLYAEYPEYRKKIGSNGRERRLTTSIFTLLDVFKEKRETSDDIEIIGLIDNNRVTRFIPRRFLEESSNLNYYKVVLPKSNGSGALGEVLSTPLIGSPLIGSPLIGYTQSFIGIGAFESAPEAEAALKYVKTKFMRTMLGILKVTQDNNTEVWAYVPMQDFTERSDIDWSKEIKDIDRQLYTKYRLDPDEISFIEEHVTDMR